MTDEKTVVELSVELNIDLQKLKNKINYAVRTGKLEVVKKSGKNYYEKKAVETLLNTFSITSRRLVAIIVFNTNTI